MVKKIFKLFYSFEKEEKWLDEMSAQGLQLVNYTWGTYHYKKIIILFGAVFLVNFGPMALNFSIGISEIESHRRPFNLYISVVSFVCCILMGSLCVSYIRKIRRLKKEKQLCE